MTDTPLPAMPSRTIARRALVLPSRGAILDAWYAHFQSVGRRLQAGRCFACGLGSCVDGQGLDRCHINARVIGGDDTVGNLHLLCRACHTASEYLSGDAYWSWIVRMSPAAGRALRAVLYQGVIPSLDAPAPGPVSLALRTRVGAIARQRIDGDGGGRVPLGYVRTPDGIIIDDDAAAIVRRIIAERRRKGGTLQSIADGLNADGIAPARGGRIWYPASVAIIWHNRDAYAGGQRGQSSVRWPAILGPSYAVDAPRYGGQ